MPKRISTKRVKQWQSTLPWIEGMPSVPKQYIKKYLKNDYYYWKQGDSYIFTFVNATGCISREFFEKTLDKDKVDIQQYYKKIGNTVYLFRRIGTGDWERIETPLKEEPYVYWSQQGTR